MNRKLAEMPIPFDTVAQNLLKTYFYFPLIYNMFGFLGGLKFAFVFGNAVIVTLFVIIGLSYLLINWLAYLYGRIQSPHYEGRGLWIRLYRYASMLVRSLLPY